jgi:hypothetical protein
MLSERQKIVVVDDVYDEIKPFLSALWKKGISCIYFDGQPENLPSSPFLGVRIIFLDIVLGTEGTSAKNKAAPAANIVKHIVGDNPSPYFIVFWTKHQELIDEVLRYLDLDNISPIGHLKLFKKPQLSDNIETTTEILNEMNSKFNELGVYEYMLAWENIVEKAAYNFSTNLFTSLSQKETKTDWSKQIATLMGTLALTYTEKNFLNNNSNDVRNAFLMMADSFKESLQQEIKIFNLTYTYPLSEDTIDKEDKAKINTSLFIDNNPVKEPSFGNVFINNQLDTHMQEALLKNIFPNSEKPENINFLGIIVTPACDISHKKYLHNSKKCFRVLYGVSFPISDYDLLPKYLMPEWIEKKKIKLIEELKTKNSNKEYIDIVNKHFQNNSLPQALFIAGPLWDNNKNSIFSIIFHFGSLSSIWFEESDIPEFILKIKEPLAFDIQSKLANHANRLGNSLLQ